MAEQPLVPGQSYDIKIAGKKTRARVESIRHQVEINTLAQHPADTLPLNGIGLCGRPSTSRWCWTAIRAITTPAG